MKILISLCIALSLFATATRTQERTYTQSDGSTFTGRQQGDAFLHWIETSDGSIVLYNRDNTTFEYAIIQNGDLVLSGTPYTPAQNGVRSATSLKSLKASELEQLWEKRH